MATKTQ